jgi:cobaltochelatase CobN
MIRIFGAPPGGHGAGVDVLIESSKWSTTEDLAEAYATWGCHAYGREWRGEKVPELFRERFSQLEVTVKNHEDREFDLLDIDDDYTILGGMNSCVRVFGGRKPLSIMGDSSDPQRLKARTLEEESRFVFRSRILNPKWVEGLKEHGFRGAMELSKLTEYMLGWDATSDIIETWMYESVTERFLLDEETRRWLEEANPYALREMASRLLEAVQRGLWDASEEMKEKLNAIYLDAESLLEEVNEGN